MQRYKGFYRAYNYEDDFYPAKDPKEIHFKSKPLKIDIYDANCNMPYQNESKWISSFEVNILKFITNMSNQMLF